MLNLSQLLYTRRILANPREQAKQDYGQAQCLGLATKNRWEDGIPHHPMSERLMCFLVEHDFGDCGDYFGWKIGGGGDNGETLMYEMDAFFELLDAKKNERTEP